MRENKKGLIILAAGNSSRMGQCKFLLQNEKQVSFLESEIKDALSYNFTRIIIVTSLENKISVEEIIKKFKSDFIELVINKHPEKERFYSLQCGLEKIKHYDFCFIHNADCPKINTETLNLLYQNRCKANVLIPTFQNKGGHPVLINQFTIKYLLKKAWNSNLRTALSNTNNIRIETCNKNILTNIDNKEDYYQYCENNNYLLLNELN